MKKYITKQSNIKGAGKGLFTKDFFKKGEVIGLAHVDDQPASEIGRNHNHNEENPTAYSKKINNKRFIYASKDLNPGEEITTNYRMQPELEQPEDFMRKGGSVLRLPNKKNSKGYSRSLSATNKLFTQNFLFEKPKSRKNKVFDPNSKYYAEGGALLTKEVTCKKCGWQWDAADGGKDITTCHECGGQGLVHAQNGGDSESNGETYKYLGRPDSLYRKSLNGRWLISNDSTGNEFVSIEDPKGSRTKELDKNAVTVSSLNKKRRDHLDKLKKEMDFPKEFINLKDTRKVRATTGEKINPNVDLKADKYNKAIIDNIIKKAKAVGVDPSTMLAIALQETNFGKTDSNLGHVKKGYKGYPYSYIDFYKQKLNEAKFKDELLQIQYYNGLGTVYPETEEDYHGYEMQKIYGVPLPASGINMRKNPLYGKQIIDLRDNVILKNPYIQKALKQKQKGGDNTDAMTGMMKARLAYANEFGNPAAERMINLPDNPYQFDNGDTGSHYMASMDNYAVPQIQDENGVLVLGDYGPESNEAIRFDSDEDANYFAENYKDVSPGFIEADLNEDEIEEYRRGGYIVEEIDTYQKGGISKVSSNSSDNTRVNNIYQKPLDWSFNSKYKNNTQAFVKKSLEEKEKAIQKEKEDSKIKKGLVNNEGIKETVGQYNRRKEKYDDLNLLGKMIENDPADNYKPQPVSKSPFEDSPMTGIGGAPKMILQAGKWLKPLWTGTKTVVKKTPQGIKYIKNSTQPFRKATVSSFKTPLPLGKKITDATGGKLNLGNSVAAYFGADALYNQGDSNSDVVKSQSNFINNPSWNTLGDASFETGINSLGLLGLGLGKQVIKPTYNASKNLIKGFKRIPKQLPGSPNTIFSKYLTPKEAVIARAERMLVQEPKWQVNSNTYTKDKFTNVNNNFEEIYANEIGKSPQVLGTNMLGKAFVFKDNGLSSANQARIAAHEIGHFYRNAAKEADEWNSFFDFSKLKSSTRKYLRGKRPTAMPYNNGKTEVIKTNLNNNVNLNNNINVDKSTKGAVYHGDEIRERAAQLKDYIAQKNGIPLNQDFEITQVQLDDAIKNYVKDTGLDNTMSAMLGALKNKKGFLKAMNKYALGTVPVMIGAETLQQKKQGGATNDYVDVDLTLEEIKDLIAQGYVIEELN